MAGAFIAGGLVGGLVLGAMSGGGGSGAADAASQANYQLGRDQLSFNKQQYQDQKDYLAKLQPYIDKYMESNQTNLGYTDALNKQNFENQTNIFQPNLEAYSKDVAEMGSSARQEQAAATAGSGVQSQIDAQRGATERYQASMGVAPDSGAATSANRVQDVLGAAARAGAENSARIGEQQRGVAARAGLIGVGQGQASTALAGVQVGNQTAGSGTGIGSTPINLNGGIGQQYTSGQLGASSMFNSSGQLGLASDQFGMQSDQNTMKGLGSIAALFASKGVFPSDENIKTGKAPIEGRKLTKAIKSMRLERWTYMPGFGDEGEHIGTYAQDFAKATGVGDGKTISIIDAIGVLQGALKQNIEDVERLQRSNRSVAITGVN